MKKSSINLPDTMVQDIRDSMALHPDGPDSITDFIKEAIAAKLAEAGITKVLPNRDGVTVATSQAQAAAQCVVETAIP